MQYRKTYLYINFQQNRVSRSVKTEHTADIQADFEINLLIRYQITTKRNYFHRRQTDGRIDGQKSRTTTISSFFQQKKVLQIRIILENYTLFSTFIIEIIVIVIRQYTEQQQLTLTIALNI